MGKKLYVGNLSYQVTSEELQEMFTKFGNVVSAQVIDDKMTGRSKGFGFVEMSSDSEAQSAIEGLHGKQNGGRALVVNEARPREELDKILIVIFVFVKKLIGEFFDGERLFYVVECSCGSLLGKLRKTFCGSADAFSFAQNVCEAFGFGFGEELLAFRIKPREFGNVTESPARTFGFVVGDERPIYAAPILAKEVSQSYAIPFQYNAFGKRYVIDCNAALCTVFVQC